MEKLTNNLKPYFYLISFNVVFALSGFFLRTNEFIHLIYTPIYFGISHQILSNRISGRDGQDYWGYSLESPSGAHENKELIILGNTIESDLEEDQKEERFLRVADHSGRIIRKILIFVYGLTFVLLKIGSEKLFGDIPLSAHLIPFLIAGLALLTTSHGQLLILPFMSLLITFTLSPLKDAHSLENLLFLFIFFLTFTSVILGANKLFNHSPHSQDYNNSPWPFILNSLKQGIKPAMTILSLYVITSFIFPASLWNPDKDPSVNNERQRLHQMNRKLAKRFLRPTRKEIEANEILLSSLRESSFKPQNFQGALDALDKNLKLAGQILKNGIPQVSLPEMEKNILINTQKELLRDKEKLVESLQFKEEYTAKDIAALSDFIKRHQQLHKDLSKHVKAFPKEYKRDIPETFNKGLQEGLNPLRNGLNNLADSKESKEVLEQVDKLAKSLEISSQNINSDSKVEAMESLKKISQNTAKKIEREHQDETIIEPKKLDSYLDLVKNLAAGFALLLILALLQKIFSQDKLETTNSDEVEKIKKELLKRKKYKGAEAEIWDRYNIFQDAVRKIYFLESEPPPPKVLEGFLKREAPINEKALVYLTEVFSQSYYGKKSFPKEVLIKYRKAFRVLVKGL